MSGYEAYLKASLLSYRFPDLVKQDILNTFRTYSDLRPKLDYFVFNDGNRKKLICLDGTIPVNYKGNTYNFPVCIWLLDSHPYNSPMVFVKPTATMLIKPGPHVDSNGKVYLPYLNDWNCPESDLLGLLDVLVIVFGESPPVFSKGADKQAYPLPPYLTTGTVRAPGILTDDRKIDSHHSTDLPPPLPDRTYNLQRPVAASDKQVPVPSEVYKKLPENQDDQKEDKTASKGATKVQAPVATHTYTDDQLLYIVNKLSPSVCCLTYPGQVATGFVVGDIWDCSTQQTYRYVITCHHLKIQQAIRKGKHCQAKFDVTSTSLGLTVDVTPCVFYEDADLDYVLIRLEPSQALDTRLSDVVKLGRLIHDVHPKIRDPLVRIGQETFKTTDVGAYAIDETDSLIQKVIQERQQSEGPVKYIGDRRFILYHSTTEGGSSGSPVFSVRHEYLYAMHCGIISDTVNVGEYAVHLWSVIQDIKHKVENNIGNHLKLNIYELFQLFPQLGPRGMEC